jgi:hypothetical protein
LARGIIIDGLRAEIIVIGIPNSKVNRKIGPEIYPVANINGRFECLFLRHVIGYNQ